MGWAFAAFFSPTRHYGGSARLGLPFVTVHPCVTDDFPAISSRHFQDRLTSSQDLVKYLGTILGPAPGALAPEKSGFGTPERLLPFVVAEADFATAPLNLAAKLKAGSSDFLPSNYDNQFHTAIGLELFPGKPESLNEGLLGTVVDERTQWRSDEAARSVVHIVEKHLKLKIADRTVKRRDHLGPPLALADRLIGGLAESSSPMPASEVHEASLRQPPRNAVLGQKDLRTQAPLCLRGGWLAQTKHGDQGRAYQTRYTYEGPSWQPPHRTSFLSTKARRS